MKYAWIQQHRDSFPIDAMCEVLKVSRSGFYKSLQPRSSPRSQRTSAIKADVKKAYEQSNGIYGSYKIAKQLQADPAMETACRNTIAKAMREMGLKSRVSKRFRPATTVADPSKQAAPNMLNQDFSAEAPNQKWVADITYLPTAAGWVYLAVVIDLFSRKVVGWKVSAQLTTPLVAEALKAAIESRRPSGSSLVHHSDRGCQYTSDAYQRTLKSMGISCSMSRVGCCYDNAVAERFFWSLKYEWTNFESFRDLNDARLSVFKYIETFYNPKRIHQALNYRSPDEFERQFQNTLAA